MGLHDQSCRDLFYFNSNENCTTAMCTHHKHGHENKTDTNDNDKWNKIELQVWEIQRRCDSHYSTINSTQKLIKHQILELHSQ
jgi:hypothetical protein